jgi:hypothetical protein
MNSYETSATVGDQGRVLVVGVPFAPGTQVDGGQQQRLLGERDGAAPRLQPISLPATQK